MRKTGLLMAAMVSAMFSVVETAGEVRSRHTCRLLLTAIMLCLSAGMIAAWPDTEAKNQAYEVFKQLGALDPQDFGASVR